MTVASALYVTFRNTELGFNYRLSATRPIGNPDWIKIHRQIAKLGAKNLKMINKSLTATALIALGTGVAGLPGDATAEWSPRKPIEMVIMAGPGGGADQMARLIQSIIEKNDLSPRPFIPINKAGGSGAEALTYMKSKAGDDYTVMITLNSFYTTPIIQEGLGIDITEFTPLGRMALDNFLLWVNTDREDITDLNTYIEAVKAAGNTWKVGGTGSGQEDSILTAMMEAAFDYDVTYIPFSGGGEVAKNLVGNHIDSTVNNPAEQNEFMRAGNTKPLVLFTAERQEDVYPGIPTAKELGHDIEYYMQRSFNGPPGMSDEARDWYINLFKTVFEGDDWQAFCADDGIDCQEWVGGDDLAAFHQASFERHQNLIEQVGAAAITGE